jgi:hypothetical protein
MFIAASFWLLAIGFWLLAFGYWLLAFGFWLQAWNRIGIAKRLRSSEQSQVLSTKY